jgi:hypothetical protein
MPPFANILFSGPAAHPCNARCPFCIGQQIDPQRTPANLDTYPLAGIDAFVERVRAANITQVVFTGANTDPLRYRPLARLLTDLRGELPAACFSLHTNGRLARRSLALLNRFDKICLSLPSFRPATYQRMMGVPGVPDLPRLLAGLRVPLKLSCVVTDENAAEIPSYLETSAALGIRRVVLRKLVGEVRPWPAILPVDLGTPESVYCGCPVYRVRGIEVTLWDFAQTGAEAINLFSSGEISPDYPIAQRISLPPFTSTVAPVIKPATGQATKTMQRAISSGVA